MGISQLLGQFGDLYWKALLTTYKLTILSFSLAALIGILITVMRLSPIKPLRAAAGLYVQIFRNIPGAALLILLVGVNPIQPGEIEAARSLGMTFLQITKNVVLPQAIRSSVLPMTNLLVATMLTTSLASQVPINPRDLTGIVSYINGRVVGGVGAFVISAVLYCLTAALIGLIGDRIDRKVRIAR